MNFIGMYSDLENIWMLDLEDIGERRRPVTEASTQIYLTESTVL